MLLHPRRLGVGVAHVMRRHIHGSTRPRREAGNFRPCWGGRPGVVSVRGGGGEQNTRSERMHPSSSTGRSASKCARRVMESSVPAAPVDVTKAPIRAGRRIRAQPRADIHPKVIRPCPSRGTGTLASDLRSRSRYGPVDARRSTPTRPAWRPAPRRTTPHRSARTTHPRVAPGSHRTLAETRQDPPDSPVVPARLRRPTAAHSRPRPPPCLFEIRATNPKMIRRWPCPIT